MCELGTSDRGEEGTYPNHGQEDVDGTENCFGWGDTRNLLWRFVASMATFNEERTPFRPFGRWDLASIAKVKAAARESGEVEVAKKDANPIEWQ